MSKLLGVWVGADHQCIVWCNQLIVGLATGLITVVNRESKRSFNSEENTQSEQNSLSYATGVIDSIKTGLGAVSEADLKPGSYVNFLQDGPICEGPLPEIVASEDFLLGPDVLEIDSSIFQVTVLLNHLHPHGFLKSIKGFNLRYWNINHLTSTGLVYRHRMQNLVNFICKTR